MKMLSLPILKPYQIHNNGFMNIEKTFWICRHGKTEWNLEGRKQGHKDSPLAEDGKVQAETLAEFFSDKCGQLFSSSLGRAVSTAQYIYERNPQLGLHADDRLKEISFGDLDGFTSAEIEQMYPGIIDHFHDDPFNNRFPNGESYDDLLERGKSFLDALDVPEIRKVIIIAHEDINRILLTLLLDLPKEDAIRISHPNDVVYRVRGKVVACFKIDGTHLFNKLIMETDL